MKDIDNFISEERKDFGYKDFVDSIENNGASKTIVAICDRLAKDGSKPLSHMDALALIDELIIMINK